MLVKKYGNRRLYDTEASRYITVETLTRRIREGTEVKVVDAKNDVDITREVLTQIIIEGRHADRFFPVEFLHQLIRLGDDALSEFFGRYLTGALEMYLQTRQTVQSFGGLNPFGNYNPFAPPRPAGEVEELRREVEQLRRSVRKRSK